MRQRCVKEFFFILAILALLAATGAWHSWAISHSRELVNRWAKNNGYVILRAESGRSHPFSGTPRGQKVWAVRFQNQHGGTQDAWLRCGGTALGYHLDDVEVRWVDPGKSAFV